jgi:hypothetical protein
MTGRAWWQKWDGHRFITFWNENTIISTGISIQHSMSVHVSERGQTEFGGRCGIATDLLHSGMRTQ